MDTGPHVELIGPTSHYYVSQRLRLHYVDWGNHGAPPMILIHGGRDHARSWDWVARDLRRDHHVIAPDLRGHGDSAWAIGGTYSMVDFVLDVAQLLEGHGRFPITILGHSLGGSIALQYTGVFPQKVARVVAIEGLGPPPSAIKERRETPAWRRMEGWISQMQQFAARRPRHYRSIEQAAARMQAENAFLSEEQALHLTVHGVMRNEDGTYSWKFDNYVRAFAPFRFDVEDMRSLWSRIDCPTLLVRGTDSWAGDPRRDGRIDAFRDARAADIERAGHWVHHDRLGEFLSVVRAFLAEA